MTKNFTTGSIIPLGDGLTGKSVLTNILLLDEITEDKLIEIHRNIKKSLNIEMEFRSSLFEKEDGTIINSSLQFYVFPGQRQKYRDVAPSFNEILDIFKFLPAFDNVNVLLLVHDISRLESLKSLESWLSVALDEGWVNKKTSICLISNKIDLQNPDSEFIQDISEGIIKTIKLSVPNYPKHAFKSFNTSCLTGEGIKELREWISKWIALNGKSLSKEKMESLEGS